MSFKKGDRVRLFSLDGTLHEHVHLLHDRWGDDDHPRNASFLSGTVEQTTHTDLMKHENDNSPVVVPDGGEWFIAIGNNHGWGRARSLQAAIANMRRQGKASAYGVYTVSKWTLVNDTGGLSWPKGIEPVEVKRVTKLQKEPH